MDIKLVKKFLFALVTTFMVCSCRSYTFISGENLDYFACSQWQNPARVDIACDASEFIRIRDVTYGKRVDESTDSGVAFCTTPYASRDDCFAEYESTETQVFSKCNFQDTCSLPVDFNTMKECLDRNYQGERYVYVKYDCLPKAIRNFEMLIADTVQDFLQSDTLSIDEWGTIPIVHLVSSTYPQFSTQEDAIFCDVSVLPATKIRATIMDVHAISESSQCSYELSLTGWYSARAVCATKYFEFNMTEHVMHFAPPETGNWTLQLQFKKDLSPDNEGKFWIALEALDPISNQSSAGISRVRCSSLLEVLTTGQTSTQRTTTSGASATTSTTTVAPGTTTTNDRMTTGTPSQAELIDDDDDMDLAPIIGGLAGGVFLIIVVVTIIAIIVCRHQYKMHKEPKNLEVIDAWSDDKPSRPPSYRNSPEHPFPDQKLDLYDEKTMYAEISRVSFPSNGGPKSSGHTNHAFDSKHDAYFDGDLYSISSKKKAKSKESLSASGPKQNMRNGNGHLSYPRRVKSHDRRHHHHGNGHGMVSHGNEMGSGELYGYTTTLDRY